VPVFMRDKADLEIDFQHLLVVLLGACTRLSQRLLSEIKLMNAYLFFMLMTDISPILTPK
jgi:hypothetical protein